MENNERNLSYENHIKECIKQYMKEHNALPTEKDLENLDIVITPLILSYSSWTAALKHLGFSITEENNRNVESTVEQIRQLAFSLGKFPTYSEIRQANINLDPIMEIYKEWKQAKSMLRQQISIKKTPVTDDEKLKIQQQLKKIKDFTIELKEIPTLKFLKDNNVNMNQLISIYGSWEAIQKELNLDETLTELILNDLLHLSCQKDKKITLIDARNSSINIKHLLKKYSWKEISTILEDRQQRLKQAEADMFRYCEKTSQIPSLKTLKEKGIDVKLLISKYGSWKMLKQELTNNQKNKELADTLKQLEEQIMDLAELLGRTPRIKDAKEYDININPLIYRYGSWNKVLNTLGLTVNSKFNEEYISNLELDIKGLAVTLEKLPTKEDLKSNNIPIYPIVRKYGSIANCLEQLGIKQIFGNTESVQDILNKLTEIAYSLKRFPTIRYAKENGINVYLLTREFGSWTDVKQAVINNMIVNS